MIDIAEGPGRDLKNIRQIGQISGNQKIYLEDYVITYLRQILTPDENMRVMILYGHKEMIEDELYWFVNGAVEAESVYLYGAYRVRAGCIYDLCRGCHSGKGYGIFTESAEMGNACVVGCIP